MKKSFFTLILTFIVGILCCSVASGHVVLQNVQTNYDKFPASIVKYQHHNVDLCALLLDSQLQVASLNKSVDFNNHLFVEHFSFNILKSFLSNNLLLYSKENALYSKRNIANSVRAP